MNFREHAAVAAMSALYKTVDVEELSDHAVGMAQTLADACCKEWGHDWVNERRDCARCGAKGLR